MKIKIKVKRTKLSACLGLVALMLGSLSIALPQVEEAASSWAPNSQPVPQSVNSGNNSDASAFVVSEDSSLNMAQRMSIVEQSLSNINQMDFPSQVAHLEQEIQQLRGHVDVLEHKLQVLQAKQKQGVQELGKNVQAVSNSKNSVGSASVASTRVASTAVAINPNLSPKEQEKRTYDAAFSLVQAHAYDDAVSAFEGYLKIYGDSSVYSANAYYWLGELYAHKQQYVKAQTALLKIVSDYPKSNKAADAMLKLGIIEQKQGNQAQANKWLQRVIADYPKTSSARLAKNYLH